MWESLKEYVSGLGRWVWAVGVGVILSVAGGVLDVFTDLEVPTWAWLLVAYVTAIVAPFIAFHRLRIRRDALQDSLDNRSCIEDVLIRLGQHRAAGVALRNKGMDLQDENELAEWLSEARDWHGSALCIIAELSQSEAEIFDTRDWVGTDRFTRVVNPERRMWLGILSDCTEHLKNLVTRYAHQNVFRQSVSSI